MLFGRALEGEQIIGAYPAFQSEFPYQAAIVGKYNGSYHRYLLGGAGILSDYLLISASRCFMVLPNVWKKYTFYASVGVNVLAGADANTREIDVIYRYLYSEFSFSNDIVISKLKESLHLSENPNLVPLNLPNKEDYFLGQWGIVAGFGMDLVEDLTTASRELIRFTSNNVRFLKQAIVLIISDAGLIDLSYEYGRLPCRLTAFSDKEICGKMPRDEIFSQRGICRGDYGNPLVINNTVIGIATKHNSDCDDTVYGSVYTKVNLFEDFINGLKTEEPIDGTVAYPNPAYVKRTKKVAQTPAVLAN